MATPVLALIMPPLEAAAIFLPIMIAQDAAAVWVYRKEWSGRIVAIVLPGAVIGVGAAWLLAAHISDAAVRVFIGVTTIAFVLYNWFGTRPVPHEGAAAGCRPACSGVRSPASPRPSARPAGRPIRCTCSA